MNSNDPLQQLLAVDVTALSDADRLDHAGMLIDASTDTQSSVALERAFVILDELARRELPSSLSPLVHYFRANAWECRRLHAGRDAWAWEQPEQEAQILELRRSVGHDGFKDLPSIRRCQIFTNLANDLSHSGRFVDAIETWDRTLTENPAFAMACGNRGRALHHYAAALYDPGYAWIILLAAHDSLVQAVARGALYESSGYDSIRAGFAEEAKHIAEHLDIPAIRQHLATHHHSLGRSRPEKQYRGWCLTNRLVVNPLNDLGTSTLAAHDVLTLPSIRDSSPSFHPPPIIGFFNQMKQEFVSARYFYFESINAEGVHFSDRGVLQYNTLDYPAYSLALEKMRASFRMAYSVLDKIAFFLNEYFELGHDRNKVSFRSVWYQGRGSSRRLLPRFVACPNLPLRGLFWLSKDFFEEDFRNSMEPDASALNDIRNHLEHKYLQLHLEELGTVGIERRTSDGDDGLGYHLTMDDFAAKSLRLLKLVRAALIYLSLTVHAEERQRDSQAGEERIVLPMPLDPWSDEWKR